MKSRDLKTIHDLIVSDYKIKAIGKGKFVHSFKPAQLINIYPCYAANITINSSGRR